MIRRIKPRTRRIGVEHLEDNSILPLPYASGSVRLQLPKPLPARYEIVLPANSQLTIRSVDGQSLCVKRLDHDDVCVWTRAAAKRKSNP